jgi:hypothetical protein
MKTLRMLSTSSYFRWRRAADFLISLVRDTTGRFQTGGDRNMLN